MGTGKTETLGKKCSKKVSSDLVPKLGPRKCILILFGVAHYYVKLNNASYLTE